MKKYLMFALITALVQDACVCECQLPDASQQEPSVDTACGPSDPDARLPDDVLEADSKQEPKEVQSCDGTGAFCACMDSVGQEGYCECSLTEATEHPDTTLWCICHHLICVDEPDVMFIDAYLPSCVKNYPDDCVSD